MNAGKPQFIIFFVETCSVVMCAVSVLVVVVSVSLFGLSVLVCLHPVCIVLVSVVVLAIFRCVGRRSVGLCGGALSKGLNPNAAFDLETTMEPHTKTQRHKEEGFRKNALRMWIASGETGDVSERGFYSPCCRAAAIVCKRISRVFGCLLLHLRRSRGYESPAPLRVFAQPRLSRYKGRSAFVRSPLCLRAFV
jgi:hypothetical protein